MMLTAVGAIRPYRYFNAYGVEQGRASCRHITETKQGALLKAVRMSVQLDQQRHHLALLQASDI